MLTRNQYVEAGNKHLEKDVVVGNNVVEKVEKLANEHTWWHRKIMDCGAEWHHEERKASNMADNTEIVAPLFLLIKDHKG